MYPLFTLLSINILYIVQDVSYYCYTTLQFNTFFSVWNQRYEHKCIKKLQKWHGKSMSNFKNDKNGKFIKTIKWHGKSMSNFKNDINRKCIKAQNDMAKVCQA